MVDDDFRYRYMTESTIAHIVDTLTECLKRSDVTPHDIARCAVLASEIHAHRCDGPIAIVLRREAGAGEYIVTEQDLERMFTRAKDATKGEG